MTEQELHALKFPVGELIIPDEVSTQDLEDWITIIEGFPAILEQTVSNLSSEQLNWRYRPDGWTIKQVVHHCSDSHINSIIRLKLALTEDNPTIRPYFEDRWAKLVDSQTEDLSNSLMLLKATHAKWVLILKQMNSDQWQRKFTHPEHGREFTQAQNLWNYAWHCQHHLAHVMQALASGGKY